MLTAPLRCLLVLVVSAGAAGLRADDAPPYSVAPGIFSPDRANLGLERAPGTRTFSVFQPGETSDHFSNGAVLIEFKGRFYAQWQSSAKDEDSPDTWVAYATSPDGENWSAPKTLVPVGASPTTHSSGGWWTDGHTLIAYLNVWPAGFKSGLGGRTEYLQSTDGETWTAPRPVLGRDGQPVAGIIEQDPHAYDGRLFTAFHLQPGLVAQPHYTDDPLGRSGWVCGTMPSLPGEKNMSREIEPSLFRRADEFVMVFRDQASTYRQLAAVSRDHGQSWTKPVLTNMPDARAKQSAGNLPDGTAFLVNAPHAGRERIPLAVTLARDGRWFDHSFLLRGADDLPPLRFAGRAKQPGYHYPKSIVARGCLWVIYATNKEDVQITRVPLAALSSPAPR